MKVMKSNNQVEFLKKNDDYEYTWVDASSNKCIDGGVMVDDTFYIGRVVNGDYSYLGRIDIGQRGLKYENSNGLEILTNQYQVLTCIEKSCIGQFDNEDKCEDKLEACERRAGSLVTDVQNIRSKYLNSERLLNETIDKNVLLTRMESMLTTQLRICETSGSQPDQPSTPAACPPSNDETENENAVLRKQTDNLNKQLITARKQNNEQARRIATIESENAQLRKLGQGVQGCLRALQSVRILTDAEQTQLMMAIGAKIPRDQLDKMQP